MAKEVKADAAFARLPRWARHRIEKLEADLAHANFKLARVGDPDSRVGWGMVVEGPNVGKPLVGIPETERVSFRLPDRPWRPSDALPRVIEVRLMIDNGIEVRANDGQLVVEPSSPNVLCITQRAR